MTKDNEIWLCKKGVAYCACTTSGGGFGELPKCENSYRPVLVQNKKDNEMTNATDKVRAALGEAEYALDRAVLFKPPQSSQREVELSAIAAVKQALRELDGMSLIETEKLEGRDGMVLVPVEPTGPQMIAGGKTHQPNKHGEHETLHSLLARETYHAMIAPYVSPEKQAVKGGVMDIYLLWRDKPPSHDYYTVELLGVS